MDLSNEPDATAKAYEMSLAQIKSPFSNLIVSRSSLLLCLISVATTGAFSVVIHHTIIDGAFLGTFFYDLFHIYLNGPGSLPEVPIQYSDFSNWLSKTSESRAELREEHLKF